MLLTCCSCLCCRCSTQSHTGLIFQDTLRDVADIFFLLTLQMQYSQSDGGVAPRYDEGEDMVRQLQANQTGVDDRLHQSQIQLFKDRQLITSGDQIDDEALDVAEGAQEGESSSEDGESDAEGDSDDDSEEGDDEEEEKEGAGPTFKGMPQEQVEVSFCCTAQWYSQRLECSQDEASCEFSKSVLASLFFFLTHISAQPTFEVEHEC